jgi:CRISPR-associated exonuclease Cas4
VDQLNDDLRVGRSISSESYSREHRGIVIGNDVVDVACERGEILVIGEVKKSSHCKEAARMQLAHYLLQLRKKGIDAVGELRFYGERRKESLVLNPETEKELETIYRGIDEICSHGSPPPLSWKKVCGSCSYRDFCWG